jgi:hypothetical protein
MQYRRLHQLLSFDTSNQTVTVPAELFRKLLMTALKTKGEFEESFYVASNPDLRTAIRKGEIPSAADHYYSTGYFENRMPKRFVVDEEWYLEESPDVRKAVQQKRIRNAQMHFDTNGFTEGRAPFEGFSLF